MRTVRQWVDWAADRFDEAGLYFGHGTDNSRDEAAWLVLHALGAPANRAFSQWEAAVDEVRGGTIQGLVAERIERRRPASYITGTAWFAGLEFEVNEAVLVPRSPIAELIAEGFRPWLDGERIHSILDIGTGSGCIAIATALRFPGTRVVASDLSEAALEVARRNVERHRVADRVRLVRSDVFDSLGPGKYDLIVSNPPYVPESGLEALPEEFRAEPVVGLVSGMEGLEITLRILAQAGSRLTESGVLVCEVGESRERLEEALPTAPFLWLEFVSGGSGVFLLEREQVADTGLAAAKLLATTRA